MNEHRFWKISIDFYSFSRHELMSIYVQDRPSVKILENLMKIVAFYAKQIRFFKSKQTKECPNKITFLYAWLINALNLLYHILL